MTGDLLTEEEKPTDGLSEDQPITPTQEQPLDFPETPATAPTHNYHVANKKYVDDSVPSVPVKATGAEINAKTNDAKFATPKAIADSDLSFELVYPSATLQLSDDAEVNSGAGGGAYIKVKELTSTVSGAIKTMFAIRKNGDIGPTTTIAGKIYVNGVAAGEEHITNNTLSDGYEVFTDAYIGVVAGDLVQVYMKSIDSMYDGQCQNFRLYWDLSTKEFVDTSIDIGDDAIIDKTLGSVVASDNLKTSGCDTERNTTSATYVKLKEIVVRKYGTVRATIDAKYVTNSSHVYVYVNGVPATGAIEHTPGPNYATFTDDIVLSYAINLVQLYTKAAATGTSYIKNFRIYWDEKAIDSYTINTD